jgi:hypothetical protein
VPNLKAADYRGVLRFLHTAGEEDGLAPFPSHVLAELQALIPCDVVSYGDYDPCGRAWRSRSDERFVGTPKTPFTPSLGRAHIQLQHEDPLPPDGSRAGQAMRWSDVLNRRGLHKLALYHEVIHPLGAEYQLRLWLIDSTRVLGGSCSCG